MYFTSSALEMRCDEEGTAHVEPGTVELVHAELVPAETVHAYWCAL
jgi:hypothetical protein